MKKLTIYKTKQEVELDLNLINNNTFTPLTSDQMDKVGFVPVFEGAMYTNMVDGYTLLKVKESVRKETKPATVEREMDKRVEASKDLTVPLDMEELLNTIISDLRSVADITNSEYLVAFDHKNKQVLVDAPEGKAHTCLKQVKKLIEGASIREGEDSAEVTFELYKPPFHVIQDILTEYVLDDSKLPNELVLEENIKIGTKTEVGATSGGEFQVHIKNQDVHSVDVTNHLDNTMRVHKLSMDWDGCIYFDLDHAFNITGIKYEAELKYKASEALDDQDNFVAEYALILPELSNLLNTLYSEIDGDSSYSE
jgi:DNA recombination-dependent growth factor C